MRAKCVSGNHRKVPENLGLTGDHLLDKAIMTLECRENEVFFATRKVWNVNRRNDFGSFELVKDSAVL